MLATLSFAALAVAFFAVVFAVFGAAVSPVIERNTRTYRPTTRAQILALTALAPTALALVFTLLCFVPSIEASLGFATDHCLHHQDGHAHFCFVHHPVLHEPIAWVAVILLLGAAIGTVGRQLLLMLGAHRLAARLTSVGQVHPVLRATVVNTSVPFAASVGFTRPRIFISDSLVRALPADQLAAVIAHESAHIARRDNLWRSVLQTLAVVNLPRVRRRLLDSFALSCEQACDEDAATRVGDRLTVADAIISVERLFGHIPLSPHAAHFGEGDIATRVEALLHAPQRALANSRRVVVLICSAAALSIVAADPLHHATETLLGLLLH